MAKLYTTNRNTTGCQTGTELDFYGYRKPVNPLTQLLTMFNAYTYTAPESLRIDRGLPGTPNLETNNRFEIHTLDLSERQIVVKQDPAIMDEIRIRAEKELAEKYGAAPMVAPMSAIISQAWK